MKNGISKQIKKVALAATIGAFMVSLFLISCKKNDRDVTKSDNSLTNIAASLNSKVLTGSLSASSSEDGLSLIFDNGTKTILLEKIPNTELAEIGLIQSAGIIVKDLAKDKVWFFVNNDEESIKRFEAIKNGYAGKYEFSKVFGTTIVNAENS
jgi:hypothetical protein